ncbi:TVP38/TMEM64 family protein [Gordonia rubripertincta]|uniref:TVP38/TMEM64 family membrane protein n=1 Tax=Gordonia rubripertincta TaxID=36822 RepID=A0AAW4G6K9_GORRU|nr:TVP38/TMEM64 family protein [Gordonia rubripertincta]MBM7278883.1 TVP38/TMEM64 family protein [Gordonia rubripertincta]QMU19710.1 TVP38/TMEM64 family protein [Gordonia rubripertincta]
MPEPAPVTEVTPDLTGSRRRVTFDRRVVRRALLAAAAVGVVLLGSYFIPLPSIGSVRAWGDDLGPAFPWLFFAAYAVVTIAPIPRSTFTVMSGIFFGPFVGFIGAMIASSIAAVAAFGLVRVLGRDRVRPFLKKPVVKAVEYRLERRGWLAVGSLRLIAACPFSVANYCSALSSVRPLPFTVASIIGMAPGTAAVVMLGDSLTGDANPAQLLVSGALFAVGIAGLILDARLPVTAENPQVPGPDQDESSSED